MHKAVICTAPGGPENLKWQEIPIPEPGDGEVLIHQKSVGLNFIDVYQRTGLYKLPSYPAILGSEASGVIEKVGPNCKVFKVGDRVAYGTGGPGAYTQYRTIHERHLVKIPAAISFEIASAMMLKGLTAQYLMRRTFNVKSHHTMLVYAAAGGVGQLLCQWGRHLGAEVIAVVSTKEKGDLAIKNGAKHVILSSENIAERVIDITKGYGVHVAYDSVGKDTFNATLDALMPLGLFVSYGQSSGKIPPFDPGILAQKGSLFFTRPTLATYTLNHQDFMTAATELFDLVTKGILKIQVGQSYYLSDAASAHRDLEARKTIGATILVTA